MGLEQTDGEGAAPASLQELKVFIEAADAAGQPSIGTAARIAWDWLQREVDIIGRLAWTHYEPGCTTRVRHNKTKKLVRLPLRDGDGLLFPELEERLATTPHRGPLVIMRDAPVIRGKGKARAEVYLPWRPDNFRHEVRAIADAAGLTHLSFASFRKGGFTELGDAEATDQEMLAAGGNKTREMLSVYSRATATQAGKAARKRRLWRDLDGTDPAQSSEPHWGSGSE